MIHHLEAQILVLLLVAALVAMGARRLKLPYTLALVVTGAVLGFVHLEALEGISLTPELLLLLFLPPLLFEAAFHLHASDLRKEAVHVGFLAVIGVGLAVGATAGLSWLGLNATGLLPGFDWGAAFLFAAVLAATDPISVLALFKEVGAPRRLYLMVEGESLINDGVAVVAFSVVLTVLGLPDLHGQTTVLSGAGEIIAYSLVTLVKTGLGGVLVGGIIGTLISVLTRQVDDHLIEVTLTTVAAWGSFLVAEQLHLSGVLSTVTAGIVIGSFGAKYGMSPTTRVAVHDFWQWMGFLANSFVFLLVGLELESASLVAELPAIAVGFVAMVSARAMVVYGATPLLNRVAKPVSREWQHVLVWGGLRGSLSMVLVLGLPVSFPQRGMLISLVFGVVAASLFGQGLTVGPLMRRLGLGGKEEDAVDYEVARGGSLASAHARHEADRLHHEGLLDDATYKRLSAYYKTRAESEGARARELAGDTMRPERLLEGFRTLAAVEREWIRHGTQAGVVTNEAATALLTDLDAKLHALDEASRHGDEAELVEHLEALLGDTKPTESS